MRRCTKKFESDKGTVTVGDTARRGDDVTFDEMTQGDLTWVNETRDYVTTGHVRGDTRDATWSDVTWGNLTLGDLT